MMPRQEDAMRKDIGWEGMVLCEWKPHREGMMLHENNAVRGMIGREGMSE